MNIQLVAIVLLASTLLSGCRLSEQRNSGKDEMDPKQFIAASVSGLQAQTSAHSATWHLGEEETWKADQDTREITFTFANGTTARAEFQIVGTYNTEDGTFLWGWDHPSVDEPLRVSAKAAKQWGEQNHVKEFTTRKVKCTEDEAWQFTAVAARLSGANGAYRGPAGNTLVFMTFGEIKLGK
jgi:hypothetical protein